MGSDKRTAGTVGIVIAVSCAAIFAIYGVVEGAFSGHALGPLLKVSAVFACFGFLFGSILAFDAEPGERGEGRPVLRTLLSALAGLCFGLVLSFPVEGVALSVLVAAALGYFGLVWARHV
jgi:hypothetical protein